MKITERIFSVLSGIAGQDIKLFNETNHQFGSWDIGCYYIEQQDDGEGTKFLIKWQGSLIAVVADTDSTCTMCSLGMLEDIYDQLLTLENSQLKQIKEPYHGRHTPK
jgi:hypothetical protein